MQLETLLYMYEILTQIWMSRPKLKEIINEIIILIIIYYLKKIKWLIVIFFKMIFVDFLCLLDF